MSFVYVEEGTILKHYKYVSAKYFNHFSGYPSAGPHPNIKGMRKHFWGKNAFIIKCGAYAFKVPYDVFTRY